MWARPALRRLSPRLSTAAGSASSSPPTCSRRTSSASASSSGRPRVSSFSPARSSRTSCSPTRSTVRRQRPSRHSSRRWRNDRSAPMASATSCPTPSWLQPHRTQSSRKAPTASRRASSTVSSCASRLATQAAAPSLKSSTPTAPQTRSRRCDPSSARQKSCRCARRCELCTLPMRSRGTWLIFPRPAETMPECCWVCLRAQPCNWHELLGRMPPLTAVTMQSPTT